MLTDRTWALTLLTRLRIVFGRGERRRAHIILRHVAVPGEGGFAGHHHYVVFINVGRVVAHDVRIAVHGQDKGAAALRIVGDEGDSVNPVFKVARLGPGAEFHRPITRRISPGNQHRLSGELSWRDTRWKRVTEPFELELP